MFSEFSFSVNKKKTLVKNHFLSRYIIQVLLDKNSLFSPETPVILSPGHIFSLANYSDKKFRPWTQFLVLTRLNSWRKDRTLSWSGLFSRDKIVKNYIQLIELDLSSFFFVLIDLKPLKLWVTDLVEKSINILGLKTLDPLPWTRR